MTIYRPITETAEVIDHELSDGISPIADFVGGRIKHFVVVCVASKPLSGFAPMLAVRISGFCRVICRANVARSSVRFALGGATSSQVAGVPVARRSTPRHWLRRL